MTEFPPWKSWGMLARYGGASMLCMLAIVQAMAFVPSMVHENDAIHSYVVVLLLLLLGMLIFVVCVRELVRFTVLSHPPLLIALWCLGTMLLPGLFALSDNTLLRLYLPLSAIVNNHQAVVGAAMLSCGLLLVMSVYLLGLRRKMLLAPPLTQGTRVRWDRFYGLYAATFLIGLGALVMFGTEFQDGGETSGGAQFVQQLLIAVSALRTLLFVIAVMMFVARRWSAAPLLVVALGEMFIVLAGGFKGPILSLGLTALLTAMIINQFLRIRRRLSRKLLASLAGLALVITVVIPVSERLRSGLVEGIYTPRAPASSLIDALRATWGTDIQESLKTAANKVAARQAPMVYAPALIYDRTPSRYEFQGYSKLLLIGAVYVPRAVWPSKPVLTEGRDFSIRYFDMPKNTTTSSAMTIFGEGYLMGGWWGVGVVSFLVGAGLAILYNRLISGASVIILLALIPTILNIESQAILMLISTINQIIVFVIFMPILIRNRKQNQFDEGGLSLRGVV
ncbi:hypothetical protein [Deinococcus peraridilitoris]|uniref:Uncharacterized protein n=1 Tax=Deinococcus peraridilitoris (strain DSM 19664 / LMG 22246 / CIP 109416 / KR-200) TaxID=937777 RepID=L0A0F5_DEIPD|nr:hypothetical protein [Deinococcus peraridilitoris]AFZ66495.1 hypothetical protein Deipe_0927 [Deinococcus peraridilitoris DSM 19664]